MSGRREFYPAALDGDQQGYDDALPEALDIHSLPPRALRRYRKWLLNSSVVGDEDIRTGDADPTSSSGVGKPPTRRAAAKSTALQAFPEDEDLDQGYTPFVTLPSDFCSTYVSQAEHLIKVHPRQAGRRQMRTARHTILAPDDYDYEYPVDGQRFRELADACLDHYSKLEVNEKDILSWFVYSIRNKDKILKLSPNAHHHDVQFPAVDAMDVSAVAP